MLSALLRDNMDEMIGAVARATETGTDEADSFVRKAMSMLQREIAAGRLDLGAVLRGDLDSVKSALNFAELGETVHTGADGAEEGVVAMLGPMRTALGGLGDGLGGIDGLLKQVLGNAGDGPGEEGGGGLFGIVGDVLGGGGRGGKGGGAR